MNEYEGVKDRYSVYLNRKVNYQIIYTKSFIGSLISPDPLA